MKLKKAFMSLLLMVSFALFFTITVGAASDDGFYGGYDGVSLTWEWHTGWNLNGDYTQATAANRPSKPAYMKRVYARSGDSGSYSEWVPSGTQSITQKDFGPYNTSLYDARFYWDID